MKTKNILLDEIFDMAPHPNCQQQHCSSLQELKKKLMTSFALLLVLIVKSDRSIGLPCSLS